MKGIDIVMRSKRGTAAVAVLLAAIMSMTFVLSGCTGFFGARVDTEGTDPYQKPNVRGVWNAGSINNKITPYFDEVISALKTANSNELNELVGKMRYSVEKTGGNAVLCSWIEGIEGQKIMLPDITLDAGSCEVEAIVPECIADYETLKYAMKVASYGIDVDIYNINETLTAAEMAEILMAWYENRTGKAVDYSSVVSSVPETASKKILALVPEYEYTEALVYNSDATTTMLVDTLAYLMSELNFEVYGVYSGGAKLIDFIKYAELYLRMYAPEGINYNFEIEAEVNEDTAENAEDTEAEAAVKLSTDWDRIVSDTNLYNTVDSVMVQSEENLTRLDLAKNMLLILKAGYDAEVKAESKLSDCSDESAAIMAENSIMPKFPADSELFTPNYEIRGRELPMLAANFTRHCFKSWNAEGSYHYYDYLTMSEMCDVFAGIESFYENYNYYVLEEEAEKVNNDVSADWFMTSRETGDFAGKNVSVAAAAMALHWSGKKEHTVETLRNAYLDKTENEWTQSRIVTVLEENGVAAAECEDITIDAVLDELRGGNIVLADYSSTGTNEAQYMIIYGFTKKGNSVRFLVKDPNAKHEEAVYANGAVPGKADTIESELALWMIGEAGGEYIVVYAEGNGPAPEGDTSSTDQ